MHSASAAGGAQFYISCGQINVTGGGSGNPGPLVAFPGAYKATDPGLMINIYYPIVSFDFVIAKASDIETNVYSAHLVYASWTSCLEWLSFLKQDFDIVIVNVNLFASVRFMIEFNIATS